ncbi:MAG: sigma-70 family RNA polymerase sigma factor [Candidatus Auribacter fodinae]|uniref:Sigma-70 family RNA polymerase sigma factor n=1 Tax=Candidatus Auribacter fodinae TaxID=2093366 RepID=A0A3A4RAI4_9BACT|nr:MAG: sigma-70 family RNA polymerase sigma factor [Candidatus Auribacter fodinae]
MKQTDLCEYSDNDLISAVREGKIEAFDQIVRRYESKVLGVLYGMMRNSDDARDVAQDVFVKAYKSVDKFRGDSKLYTWLYRITVNMAIDYMRKKQKKAKVEYNDEVKISDDNPAVPVDRINPSKTVQNKELRTKLQEAIEQLPEEQKSTFVLREMQDMSYQEIADVMNCSVGTVMSRLFYARKKVRDMIKPYLEGVS